jgi:hypothetical protein
VLRHARAEGRRLERRLRERRNPRRESGLRSGPAPSNRASARSVKDEGSAAVAHDRRGGGPAGTESLLRQRPRPAGRKPRCPSVRGSQQARPAGFGPGSQAWEIAAASAIGTDVRAGPEATFRRGGAAGPGRRVASESVHHEASEERTSVREAGEARWTRSRTRWSEDHGVAGPMSWRTRQQGIVSARPCPRGKRLTARRRYRWEPSNQRASAPREGGEQRTGSRGWRGHRTRTPGARFGARTGRGEVDASREGAAAVTAHRPSFGEGGGLAAVVGVAGPADGCAPATRSHFGVAGTGGSSVCRLQVRPQRIGWQTGFGPGAGGRAAVEVLDRRTGEHVNRGRASARPGGAWEAERRPAERQRDAAWSEDFGPRAARRSAVAVERRADNRSARTPRHTSVGRGARGRRKVRGRRERP